LTPLSLFEINEYIRQVIALNFTEPVWIRAEINQCSFSRGHCYLDLIEKKEEGEDIIAQASAAIWYRNLKFIEHKTGPGLSQLLQKGVQVLLKVKIDYNERYGLKFNVEDIDTSFTLGQLELKRREVLNELEKKGLIEKNKKILLPAVIQKIAVISSERAAGLQDFISHLQENAYDFAFRCELFSAAMQGKNVEREVIRACLDILKEKEPYDAVIIIRGGGSKLDLSPFDGLRLCMQLADMPFPVITGIGHDIDQSIADLVAHTSLKTPTAVANYLIDHNVGFESSLFERLRHIETFAHQIIKDQNRRIQRSAESIKYLAIQTIQNHKFKLNQYRLDLNQRPLMMIKAYQLELDSAHKVLNLIDPYTLLQRGYSMTTKGGILIKNMQQVNAGDIIETRLAKGTISSIVK
jgi:exodeoxyribonuclease VII large subunit